MKVYHILALLVISVALLVSRATAKDNQVACSHNFVDGIVQPYDRLLYRTEIDKPRKTNLGFGVKRIEEVQYPPVGTSNVAVISAVRIFDLVVNGTGGFVNKVTYGPSRQSVLIRLKSQRGEGYKFLIEIWGH